MAGMILGSIRRAALFALAFVPHLLEAQAATTGTVRGRVTDAGTGRAVAEVSVGVAGTRLGATSSDNGEFTIAGVPTGSRSLLVRRIGYQPATRTLTVNAGDNSAGDIALTVS